MSKKSKQKKRRQDRKAIRHHATHSSVETIVAETIASNKKDSTSTEGCR